MQTESPAATRAALVVSGVGVVSAIGQGKEAFADALLRGDHAFGVMRRPGRQRDSHFIGAELAELPPLPGTSAQARRTMSLSAQAALAVVSEAWHDACLFDIDPERIGLIVGGSNFQQRELTLCHEAHRSRPEFVRPTYALSFMDTDVCGACTAHFGIRGLSYTIGGASAAGQIAVLQAAAAVASGQVDACIAVGALMDLSYWECQAFRSLGAMGSDKHADRPAMACRPFDRARDGFIFGESCGAVVIEAGERQRARGAQSYARMGGWGMAMDANRNPDPSVEGEMRAIRAALHASGWQAADVDYVNPHGTASLIGDEVELRALRKCGLEHARINATKSLIGHGISAAGVVEIVATLLQMKHGRLHPTRNLDEPIDAGFNWVSTQSVAHQIQRAVTLSMGFGGINSALCWERQD